jgi:5-methylcytosine-specific restriction protein A
MPSRPLRPCPVNGCPELVEKGRCPTHTTEQERGRRQSETWRKVRGARGGTIDFYQSEAWRSIQARVLREANYLCQCEECRARAYPRLPDIANTVDHIISVRERPDLRLTRSNLQAMSQAHHSRKTARETVNA